MKKYLHISMDTVEKVCDCFCDDNEMVNFVSNIDDLARELSYVVETGRRTQDDALRGGLAIKEICVLALFFREHIELIHEVIKAMHLEEVTEEQFKKLKDM